tara:strand:+ start:895 stop:1578 length:684 start_codon:yes stop_codon:yes gene_type:complete
MIKQRIITNTGICHNRKPFDGSTLSEQVESGHWGFRPEDALWFAEDKHITYRPLANQILKKYPNKKNILEIGCGAGSLSYHLRDINSDLTVVTLDGNQGTLKSPYIKDGNHFIVLTDSDYELVDENNNIILFDLVLCFEHFEHIHVDRFGKFLENIKKHSTKDTVIIATASTWPDGRDHCNVKNRDGWIEYLNSEGFEIIDNTIIEGNAPFNFEESLTSELVFKIKS